MSRLTGLALEQARDLHANGMATEQIAGLFGVSRHDVGRAVKPIQYRAYMAYRYALQVGDIEPADTCEECGSDHHIQGHHDDYTRPLDVRWLCAACHCAIHAGDRDYGRPTKEDVRAVWAVSMARQMSREELLGTESLDSVVATYRRWTGWTGDTLAREDHHPTRTEAA